MTCQEAVELMQRDLDHDLSDSERQTMLAHMSRCSECADVYSRLQQLSLNLANIPKVLPPYSLVDSILPRLEEIDRLRMQETTEEHLSAASQRGSAVQPLKGRGWLGRLRQSFPLSAIGGVAAASIVLALFVSNQDHSIQEKNADSSLMSREMAASSQSAEGNKGIPNSASGSETKMHVSDNKIMMAPISDAPVSKEDKDREIASAKPEETPAVNQLKQAGPSNAVSTNSAASTPSSAGDARQVPGGEAGQNSAELSDNTASRNTQNFTSEPAGAGSAPAAENSGPQKNQEITSADRAGASGEIADTKSAGPSALPSAEPSAGPASKSTDAQMVPGFTPAPSPRPEALEPPISGKLPALAGGIGSMMGIANVDENRLESPDAQSVAIYDLDTKRVSIVKASDENQILYISETQWSDKDRITLNVWKSNTQVSYTVTQGEFHKTFIIDLVTKQETVETTVSAEGTNK